MSVDLICFQAEECWIIGDTWQGRLQNSAGIQERLATWLQSAISHLTCYFPFVNLFCAKKNENSIRFGWLSLWSSSSFSRKQSSLLLRSCNKSSKSRKKCHEPLIWSEFFSERLKPQKEDYGNFSEKFGFVEWNLSFCLVFACNLLADGSQAIIILETSMQSTQIGFLWLPL